MTQRGREDEMIRPLLTDYRAAYALNQSGSPRVSHFCGLQDKRREEEGGAWRGNLGGYWPRESDVTV